MKDIQEIAQKARAAQEAADRLRNGCTLLRRALSEAEESLWAADTAANDAWRALQDAVTA